jgi:hypothetical protein
MMAKSHAERAKMRERVAAGLKAGKSIAEMVAMSGLCAAYVAEIGRNLGIRNGTTVTTFSCYRLLADLLNTEDSLTEIARRNRCSKQLVEQVFSRSVAAGINIKRRTARKK